MVTAERKRQNEGTKEFLTEMEHDNFFADVSLLQNQFQYHSRQKQNFHSLLHYHLNSQVPTLSPSLETAALALQFNIRQVLCVPAGMNSGLFLTQPSFPALQDGGLGEREANIGCASLMPRTSHTFLPLPAVDVTVSPRSMRLEDKGFPHKAMKNQK